MAYTQLVISLRRTAVALCLLAITAFMQAQQWHTTIEIGHPAELTLPEHVSDVLLVNNTVPHPDLPTGAFYTLMAASEVLESSYLLPSVLETSQNSSVSLYRRQLLTNQRADSLLSTYHADALLVLNQLIVHPSTDSYLTDRETYYAYTQAIVGSHWSLFFRRDGQPGADLITSRTLVYADTLYWEKEDELRTAALQALPANEDVRNEMAIYAGEQLARRLMPTFETADRYLYDLGASDAGMQAFVRKQWQQAIEAWSAPQADIKRAAYAAANRAVACEIIGDISDAYTATEQAIAALSQLRSPDARQQAVNIRYYQTLLQQRMAK